MPTQLGTAYPPTWNGRPPHMAAGDLQIYYTWWPTVRANYDRVYYDVGLGDGAGLPEDATPDNKALWLKLTQKRADVIAHGAAGWEIIELRTNAQANAIGRLQIYRMLWLDDPPSPEPVTLTLVTDRLDLDVQRLARLQAVTYIALP